MVMDGDTDRLCLVDWEHPQTMGEGVGYLQIMETLRWTLPSPKYLLTTALPVGEYVLKHIDVVALSRHVNFLNLMCYDYTGPWTSVSGHQAQLRPPPGHADAVFPDLRTSSLGGIEYLRSRGFPMNKLVLGIPAYARYFPNARGPGQPFNEAGEIDYSELPVEWIQYAYVDPAVGAASYVDESKGFVSFDVPTTVKMKGQFAREMGLAGLFYWTGVGDVQGPNSLVAAGCEALSC
jgi:chitinase